MPVYLKNIHTARVSIPGRRGSIEFANPGQIIAVEDEAMDQIGRPTEDRPGRRPRAGQDVKRYFKEVSKADYDAATLKALSDPTIPVDRDGVPIVETDEMRAEKQARIKTQHSREPIHGLIDDKKASDQIPPPPPPKK